MEIIDKIKSCLAPKGEVKTETCNMKISVRNANEILERYKLPRVKKISFINDSLITITVKINEYKNLFAAVNKLVNKIQSQEYEIKTDVFLKKNRWEVEMHFYRKIISGLDSQTTINDVMVLENLHDKNLSASEKLNFLYKKIVIVFN